MTGHVRLLRRLLPYLRQHWRTLAVGTALALLVSAAEGMVTPDTLAAPSASTAMQATRAESMPPESPTTTLAKPALESSSRMNPSRMRAVSSQ